MNPISKVPTYVRAPALRCRTLPVRGILFCGPSPSVSGVTFVGPRIFTSCGKQPRKAKTRCCGSVAAFGRLGARTEESKPPSRAAVIWGELQCSCCHHPSGRSPLEVRHQIGCFSACIRYSGCLTVELIGGWLRIMVACIRALCFSKAGICHAATMPTAQCGWLVALWSSWPLSDAVCALNCIRVLQDSESQWTGDGRMPPPWRGSSTAPPGLGSGPSRQSEVAL
ncbi:hypothetical protein VTI74DRAFT_9818 [Chaetomium olivicolor]